MWRHATGIACCMKYKRIERQQMATTWELERRVSRGPGLRCLCGLEILNPHTLSEVRMAEGDKLEQLLVQMVRCWNAKDC